MMAYIAVIGLAFQVQSCSTIGDNHGYSHARVRSADAQHGCPIITSASTLRGNASFRWRCWNDERCCRGL